jgi:hypothetical protein
MNDNFAAGASFNHNCAADTENSGFSRCPASFAAIAPVTL